MTTTIDPLPPPPDPSDSKSVFNSKAFAFWAAMPTLRAQINIVNGEAYASAVAAAASASTATTKAAEAYESANSASANAIAAAASAGATAWVSGASYADGQRVWSPINQQLYRRVGAGAGTTDPSLDDTNWALVRSIAETLCLLTAGVF